MIYIGKAKSLKKRIASYFKKGPTDWKVQALIDEHESVDHILTTNEESALLLEASLISEHQPKYNVLLKSGQPFLYICFVKKPVLSDAEGPEPGMMLVRSKKAKGSYFGPFLTKTPARAAFNFLERTFKLKKCNKKIANGCLDYHIGTCPGTCMPTFDATEYQFRLDLAQEVLRKNHAGFIKNLEAKIKELSSQMEFEKAKNLHEYVVHVSRIFQTIESKFSPKQYEDKVFAATTPLTGAPHIENLQHELKKFLEIDATISTIDCFDISHFQSSYIVGSCVRFKDGQPDKNNFRRFKIKTLSEQNDYAALQEIVARRYRNRDTLPDLIVIDGGKGQLSAVKHLVDDTPIISLAKREERIFSDKFPEGKVLDIHTDIGKLFIALRDYAHHFAVSYHRLRRHAKKEAL